MNQRNWLDLSRKLVDRADLNYSFSAVQQALGNAALSYWGEGVLKTTVYPNPFPITLATGNLTGNQVGGGIAFDANGQLTELDPTSSTPQTFTIQHGDATHPRWDLLVIQYVQSGANPVPAPSNPLTTVNLNLVDDFVLILREGTPSATPSYPAAQANDIILAGIQVPVNASLGIQCTVDLSIRQFGNQSFASFPTFNQEVPSGTINGSNTVFTLSQSPLNHQSLLVMLDNLVLTQSVDYSISGTTITMLTNAPAVGQSLNAYYVVNNSQNGNPISGAQEVPTGTVDGSNATFTLTGVPIDQLSTLVMVDGLVLNRSQWGLVSGSPNAQITFTAGNIPQPGQSILIFYLQNVRPLPVNNGSLFVIGSTTSPAVISASIGIPATTNERALWFVASSGGAVPVTANPQISAGVKVGQELILRGTSNTNYITLADGNGLSLSASINLDLNDALYLAWDGSVWFEISRR